MSLLQNGGPDTLLEHNMAGPAGPMTKHTELANLPDVLSECGGGGKCAELEPEGPR